MQCCSDARFHSWKKPYCLVNRQKQKRHLHDLTFTGYLNAYVDACPCTRHRRLFLKIEARSMQPSMLRKAVLSSVISMSLGALCMPACVWAQDTSAAGDHGPANSNSNAAPTDTDKEDEGSGKKKVKDLQGVHVVAPRTTEEMARFTQENAPNLINIRTGDEIRALPDVNTAEAVRRIPGISMETDEGEGRYVNIRGFDADLNSTTYAGVRLLPTNNASPFGGYRAVALDSIPTGFIGAVEVTKSNLPSQD